MEHQNLNPENLTSKQSLLYYKKVIDENRMMSDVEKDEYKKAIDKLVDLPRSIHQKANLKLKHAYPDYAIVFSKAMNNVDLRKLTPVACKFLLNAERSVGEDGVLIINLDNTKRDFGMSRPTVVKAIEELKSELFIIKLKEGRKDFHGTAFFLNPFFARVGEKALGIYNTITSEEQRELFESTHEISDVTLNNITISCGENLKYHAKYFTDSIAESNEDINETSSNIRRIV